MNLIKRLEAIESRLSSLEMQEDTFEYSRAKDNKHNIVKELKRIKDIVGIEDVVESQTPDGYWERISKQ